MCVDGCIKAVTLTRFSKMLTWFPKKSPGQSVCTRVVGRATPQFSRLEDSVQQFTCNESLAYKHKNNVINNNVLLRVTTADMTYFAVVHAPCACVTRVQDVVTKCCDGYSACYIGDYITLKVRNASR